jgi:hypothetical protein
MKDRVIRISIAKFDAEKIDVVRNAMRDSYDKLAPGIRSMTCNRGYFAGLDAENNAIVNVSALDTLNAVEQMASFRPILDLAEEFTRLGVGFEHPDPQL